MHLTRDSVQRRRSPFVLVKDAFVPTGGRLVPNPRRSAYAPLHWTVLALGCILECFEADGIHA
jgi:hypothetical protein